MNKRDKCGWKFSCIISFQTDYNSNTKWIQAKLQRYKEHKSSRREQQMNNQLMDQQANPWTIKGLAIYRQD